MSFEWRTDEDEGWQESTKRGGTAESPPFWQRRWRFLLVALLGVAAVWLVVQWQINQRVATATTEVESELLATHNFVLQTAVDQDEALFRANLSGRNPAWGEVQKTLLGEGLLLDRPMFGWQHEIMPNPLMLEDVTITLAPSFNAAELLYPQTYTVKIPSGVTETVTFQQTAVYRLGERRWLYAPPRDEFWGDWITQGGGYVTLAYPERDRSVGTRLGLDLDKLVGQMCAELVDLHCGSDLRIHLRLDPDPESLLAINENETMLTSGLRLELPTPTLVGLPTDETSYEVLYRAYGAQLATAVLAHQIEYDCCRHGLFFRALLDYQLAQLGLQAWPLEEAMYGQMLSAGFNGNVLRHWTRRWEEAPPQFLQVWVIEDPDPIWQQVYMLIEYLNEQETAVSPTEMMRLLDRNSYHGWVKDVLSDNYDQSLFPTIFLEYIYAQSIVGQQAESPVPLPKGQVIMICNDGVAGFNNRIYAFDLASQNWNEIFTDFDRSINGYFQTLDGKNFIYTESNYVDRNNNNTNRFYLVTEDDQLLIEEVELLNNSEHFIYYYVLHSPEKLLVRYEYDQGEIEATLRSLDCPTSDCPGVMVAGYPVFSPNGQYLIEHVPSLSADEDIVVDLLRSQFQLSVVSVDGEFRRPIGQGGIGFWLDNNNYGFVQNSGDSYELITSSLAQPQTQVLLREADLLAEIPDFEGSSTSLSGNVFSVPNRHDLFLQVLAGDGPERQNHLFRLQLTDDRSSVVEIDLLWLSSHVGGIRYSPDGRYLILVENNVTSSSSALSQILLDLETGQVSEPIVSRGWNSINWSPDGRWFVQNTENYLLLHAPAYDYQYYIPHGFGDCQQVILSVNE